MAELLSSLAVLYLMGFGFAVMFQRHKQYNAWIAKSAQRVIRSIWNWVRPRLANLLRALGRWAWAQTRRFFSWLRAKFA